jgi:serine/threonine protein kinase
MARKLDHPHIVKFVGGFKQESKSYLMFQWADGGNLREYWNDSRNWGRTEAIISWTINQMLGLAEALHEWHNYYPATQMNCRHGDLKPENIVRSKGPGLGKFQIADLGLAKVHSLPTHMRNKPSLSSTGTFRYRSPEIKLGGIQKISRSYDMWSMGCMVLEWIIWLLYGRNELNRFQEESFTHDSEGFFVITEEGPRIHRNVLYWIEHMETTCLKDGEICYSGALRHLLVFVKERLLIEDPDTEDATQRTPIHRSSLGHAVRPEVNIIPELATGKAFSSAARAKSEELCDTLRWMKDRSLTEGYIFEPRFVMSRPNREGPTRRSTNTFLMPTIQQSPQELTSISLGRQPERQANTKDPYATPSALDVWNTHTDNLFAKSVFSNLDSNEISGLAPAYPVSTSLCGECSSAQRGLFSRSSFSVSYEKAQESQATCALCAMLCEKMREIPGEDSEKMILREESSLTTARGESPVLSIVVGPTQGMYRTQQMLKPDDIDPRQV